MADLQLLRRLTRVDEEVDTKSFSLVLLSEESVEPGEMWRSLAGAILRNSLESDDSSFLLLFAREAAAKSD